MPRYFIYIYTYACQPAAVDTENHVSSRLQNVYIEDEGRLKIEKRKEGGLKRINCVVLSSCGWLIDRWEGRRGWSPLHATISLGGETTAVVDAYRSPRAPHITITMVYNAVSAKISRGYTGYTPFRVPSPVKNLINRHRGGGGGSRVPSSSSSSVFRGRSLYVQRYVRLFVIYSNLIGKFIQIFRRPFPIFISFRHLPPLLSPPSLSLMHVIFPTLFVSIEFIDSRDFCNEKEKGDEFLRVLERFPI